MTWNELHTTDIDAAEAFYGPLFGWTFEAMDTGEGNPAYHAIKNGERMNGGIMNTQPNEPPNWLPYIAVDSLDDTMSAATDSGGQVHAGPIPMPQGRIAVLQDPQGAFFALWEGPLED
jgi:predicted enzyme related to lactoylglutathione lyase